MIEPTRPTCIILGLDPRRERERAYRVWRDHLTRAWWMVERGYEYLLRREYH
jgi:hypothetical protein